MQQKNYQDILAFLNSPTQYLGNEINSIKKDTSKIQLNFALVFPDLYEIGTSHFGLQILYSILNSYNNIAAQRFFSPDLDMEAILRKNNIPILSLESKQELNSFDIVGISLLYELNFTNILNLFDLSNIPFYRNQREDLFPLIIGGGPCAFNPEPLSDFFDAFVIGDGEEVIVQIANQVIEFKKHGDNKKHTLLRLLSKIQGVYVPSFFKAEYDKDNNPCLLPLFEDYKKVTRAFVKNLTKDNFPLSPVVPFAKPVHDRLRLEISRGCSRGCRFCQAGMIYRPVRERSVDDLINITKESLKNTGYSDISLLSLSTGDYSNLSILMSKLLGLEQGYYNSISLPSIRAEKLTCKLMDIIKKVRKTGFTIAPEAGSQRLRDIINKNLSQESIAKTIENAFNNGWKNIKLYFMIGLPFEEHEDIKEICSFSKQMVQTYAKGKKNINVSINTFIPKPHTPFQRCSQISLTCANEKLQYLKNNLRHPKIKLKWQDPHMSFVEGVFARGDRKLSKLLVTAFNLGCRLDGWSDKFDFSLWEKAFEKANIDPDFYTTRNRENDKNLAWDIIDSRVLKKFLKNEFQKAKDKTLTADCSDSDIITLKNKPNKCTGCGVCDFENIYPVRHKKHDNIELKQENKVVIFKDDVFQTYEISFAKRGKARFFGHLELSLIIKRAIKRARLNVKYSKGFHPDMVMSFETALPVGMESEHEKLFVCLAKNLNPFDITKKLNQALPEGIDIKACKPLDKKIIRQEEAQLTYEIKFNDFLLDKQQVKQFFKLKEFIVKDLSKKGKTRQTDLRKAVKQIEFLDCETIKITIKKFNERIIRPDKILKEYFNLDDDIIKKTRVKKICS